MLNHHTLNLSGLEPWKMINLMFSGAADDSDRQSDHTSHQMLLRAKHDCVWCIALSIVVSYILSLNTVPVSLSIISCPPLTALSDLCSYILTDSISVV